MTNQIELEFTDKERRLAKAGYCYSVKESSGGLRKTVKDLRGKTHQDVIFDELAYQEHNGMTEAG